MASAPIETKVKAATWSAFGVGVLIAVLNESQTNSQLLGSAPPWFQAMVTVAVPPLVTFLAGYTGPHTSREHD